MQEFVLDWKIMKNWPPILWGVFTFLVAAGGYIIVDLFFTYAEYSLEGLFVYMVLSIAFYFWYRGRDAIDVHIHHYVVGFIAVLLISYQSVFFTFVSAIFSGVMIEGASRWGYDPIWTYPYSEDMPMRVQLAIQRQKLRLYEEGDLEHMISID